VVSAKRGERERKYVKRLGSYRQQGGGIVSKETTMWSKTANEEFKVR